MDALKTVDDLLHLSPLKFQEMTMSLYKALGCEVWPRRIPGRHHLYVDIMTKDKKKSLAECRIGLEDVDKDAVESFAALLKQEKVSDGAIITIVGVTEKARQLARKKRIFLYDGNDFLGMWNSLHVSDTAPRGPLPAEAAAQAPQPAFIPTSETVEPVSAPPEPVTPQVPVTEENEAGTHEAFLDQLQTGLENEDKPGRSREEIHRLFESQPPIVAPLESMPPLAAELPAEPAGFEDEAAFVRAIAAAEPLLEPEQLSLPENAQPEQEPLPEFLAAGVEAPATPEGLEEIIPAVEENPSVEMGVPSSNEPILPESPVLPEDTLAASPIEPELLPEALPVEPAPIPEIPPEPEESDNVIHRLFGKDFVENASPRPRGAPAEDEKIDFSIFQIPGVKLETNGASVAAPEPPAAELPPVEIPPVETPVAQGEDLESPAAEIQAAPGPEEAVTRLETPEDLVASLPEAGPQAESPSPAEPVQPATPEANLPIEAAEEEIVFPDFLLPLEDKAGAAPVEPEPAGAPVELPELLAEEQIVEPEVSAGIQSTESSVSMDTTVAAEAPQEAVEIPPTVEPPATELEAPPSEEHPAEEVKTPPAADLPVEAVEPPPAVEPAPVELETPPATEAAPEPPDMPFVILQPDQASQEHPKGPDVHNPALCLAIQRLEAGSPCLFVTGRPGSGKNLLLENIQSGDKNVVILAPAPADALEVEGQTIRSFFQFQDGPLSENDVKELAGPVEKSLYQHIDVLVLDQVAKISPNLMDSLDMFLRLNGKDAGQPFGGVQVVLLGDLFQAASKKSAQEMTDLLGEAYRSPFFFDAHVFQNLPIELVELHKDYDHREEALTDLLDPLRTNGLDEAQYKLLNDKYLPDFTPPEETAYITLTSNSSVATRINREQLKQLRSPECLHIAEIEGEFDDAAYPADKELILRRGAQVVFLKDDYSRKWTRGTLGKITNISESTIQVEINSDGFPFIFRVERETWQSFRYRYDPASGRIEKAMVGEFTQYPLRAGWAMAVQKTQGARFENGIIDLSGEEAEVGMLYAALCCCRKLDGIVLKDRLSPKFKANVGNRIQEVARLFNE